MHSTFPLSWLPVSLNSSFFSLPSTSVMNLRPSRFSKLGICEISTCWFWCPQADPPEGNLRSPPPDRPYRRCVLVFRKPVLAGELTLTAPVGAGSRCALFMRGGSGALCGYSCEGLKGVHPVLMGNQVTQLPGILPHLAPRMSVPVSAPLTLLR